MGELQIHSPVGLFNLNWPIFVLSLLLLNFRHTWLAFVSQFGPNARISHKIELVDSKKAPTVSVGTPKLLVERHNKDIEEMRTAAAGVVVVVAAAAAARDDDNLIAANLRILGVISSHTRRKKERKMTRSVEQQPSNWRPVAQW